MNVYDFDGTIYDGDCTIDFYLFCLKKDFSLIRFFPFQIKGFVLYTARKIDKTQLKEFFFYFLRGIKNIDETLKLFWQTHSCKIKKWYVDKKQIADIIISASPEFLLLPICEELGVRLIASKVDKHTGIFSGKNCFGKEKVSRFQNEFPNCVVDEFYTDSHVDAPFTKIANKSFFVKGNQSSGKQFFSYRRHGGRHKAKRLLRRQKPCCRTTGGRFATKLLRFSVKAHSKILFCTKTRN